MNRHNVDMQDRNVQESCDCRSVQMFLRIGKCIVPYD